MNYLESKVWFSQMKVQVKSLMKDPKVFQNLHQRNLHSDNLFVSKKLILSNYFLRGEIYLLTFCNSVKNVLIDLMKNIRVPPSKSSRSAILLKIENFRKSS